MQATLTLSRNASNFSLQNNKKQGTGAFIMITFLSVLTNAVWRVRIKRHAIDKKKSSYWMPLPIEKSKWINWKTIRTIKKSSVRWLDRRNWDRLHNAGFQFREIKPQTSDWKLRRQQEKLPASQESLLERPTGA